MKEKSENANDDLKDLNEEEVEIIYDEDDDYYSDDGAAADAAEENLEASDDEVQSILEEEEDLERDGYQEKYMRLYAEFENYKKRALKDKDEIVNYANERLILDLLPSLDNLETALKHADNGKDNGIVEGVEMTLRELYRMLEKFGLNRIETDGQPFNPEFHHAVSQVERDDMDEMMIVEEFRSGFMFKDKVLRASMVSVSKKASGENAEPDDNDENKETRDIKEDS